MANAFSSASPASGNWAIAQLPGLNAEDCDRLERSGIQTTAQLLQTAMRPEDGQQLAAQLQISWQQIRKWVALADLARVPGVGCDRCGILLHCGIASVAQLAQASIHRLYPQLTRLYVATTRRRDLCPPRGEVIRWIQSARQLSTRSR